MLSRYIAEQEIIRRLNKTKRSLRNFSNNGYSGYQQSLFFAYQSLLGRNLSGNELESFIETIEKKHPKEITKLILYSCESLLRNSIPPKSIYFSIFEILNNSPESFIKNIYMLMIGRDPTPTEFQIWNKRLKYTNRLVVFLMFLRVNEYRQNYKLLVLSETSFKLIFKTKMYYFAIKYFIKGNPALYNNLFKLWK